MTFSKSKICDCLMAVAFVIGVGGLELAAVGAIGKAEGILCFAVSFCVSLAVFFTEVK